MLWLRLLAFPEFGGIVGELPQLRDVELGKGLKNGSDHTIYLSGEKSLKRHSHGAEEEGAGDEAIEDSLGQGSYPSAKTKGAFSIAVLGGLVVGQPFCRIGVTGARFYAAHLIKSGDCLPTTNNTEL
jgi:hypothetical protein